MIFTIGTANPVQPQQQRFWPDSRPLVERLGADFFRQLPEKPGVYLMHGTADIVLYVGKAKSLRHRLGSYRVANPDRMRRRHLRLLQQVVRIELEECSDEAAALAREAELLRTLKPKFNRAGVWIGPPRFLIWRIINQTVELAITKTPITGWQVFGPCGSGVIYLRAALVRLLWLVLNPSLGSHAMPVGWWRGQLGAVVTIESISQEMELALVKLLAGETEGFIGWIGERTAALGRAYDQETRDTDLETVITLVEAKLRRTLPFHTAEESEAEKPICPAPLVLFAEEESNVP
jgi:hypothetical protein